MVFFKIDERWAASEKLSATRESLLMEAEDALGASLEMLGCSRIAPLVWRHEASDTIIHLSCLPRTHN
jgi:hypothetical protein